MRALPNVKLEDEGGTFPLARDSRNIRRAVQRSLLCKNSHFLGQLVDQSEGLLKEKTTFMCRFGTEKFEVMPVGLMNAPSTFQRMMDNLLVTLPFFKIYLDEIVVFSSDIHWHLLHLKEFFELVVRHGLNSSQAEREFAKKKFTLLGHVIDYQCVSVNPRNVDVV